MAATPEDRILDEHERQNGQQGSALERRQGDSIAEKPAEGFPFDGDHGDDLALGNAPEMRQRKPQDAAEKLIAQAAQHPLAELALIDIEPVFEPAIDENEGEESAAQDQQEIDLPEAHIEDPAREVGAADGLVDDGLGQVQGNVEERHGYRGHDQQNDLLTQTVAKNVLEDCRFHAGDPTRFPVPLGKTMDDPDYPVKKFASAIRRGSWPNFRDAARHPLISGRLHSFPIFIFPREKQFTLR